MRILVQKYGGSSVGDVEKIRLVARKVKERRDQGFAMVVVVSAMGNTTDELLGLAKQVSPNPPRRELDMLLTCGERISMALLSMAMHELDVPAVSFTGSQSGIITDDNHSQARIVEVRPQRIEESLEQGKVVIVAGYQGVSLRKEVTTLGRGGSDTTAVALAAALSAEACEIYSDVDGVFSADPRVVPDAVQLSELSYDEMQAMACAGARVLNAQAVQFAKEKGIIIQARSSFGQGNGTAIREGAKSSAARVVKGVAVEDDLAVVWADGDAGGGLAELLSFLHSRGAGSSSLAYDGSSKGRACLVVPLQDAHGLEALRVELDSRPENKAELTLGLASVTCVGAGMGTEQVAAALLVAKNGGIPIRAFQCSALQLSLLVDRSHAAELCRRLHRELVLPA